ncbi:SGNH/GDSL hydrolase family protein [Clavibacter californiensis]|uniref:SGNH/GDSL hydrolase family protein n=1 Tax=Clavibacter californiensis TaxID=1401995 RepID=A0ABX9N7B4_9MICO|nr:SGNH/GDSL hydrolase family protein [Clavibacter californiensis]RII93464.1 SGNH/GDSL hydrolase family protein [Clavibacter californiensis]UKF80040.1 SGNH/GDSL hydrolase family protein [Clavibacter californiensis]
MGKYGYRAGAKARAAWRIAGWTAAAAVAACSVGLVVAALGSGAEPVGNAGAVAESGFVSGPGTTIAPVAPLELPEDPAVLMFGDSFILGHGIETSGRPAYPALLAEREGWTDVRLNAAAGTGFAATSDQPAYPDRLAAMDDDFTPDLVVLQGSVNDIKPGEVAVRSGVTRILADIAERWPDAQTVIITPMTGVQSYEKLASAYTGPALGKAHVIDATGPESWLPVDRPELRTEDEWHPSATGHEAIAAGIQTSLTALAG